MSKETLVCFAVKEEASPFKRKIGNRSGVRILVTGMGKRNAERSIREVLATAKPELMLTCGFAGGLHPELKPAQIVFSAGPGSPLEARLVSAGGTAALFHCAPSVATTAKAKELLRETTGADAVEMESAVIRKICDEHQVPCAIVRVILDTAEQDLPIDFNQVMTSEQDMDYFKLAFALAKAPQKIPALMRFQKETQAAAQALADFLVRVV